MIKGICIKRLKVEVDERGRLIEILRSDDEFFSKFGQIYMTTAYPNVIKAWHYHKKQIDNFAVVKGMAKVVLFDAREDSPSFREINEFFLGVHNPILLQIPNLIYHGFKCISEEEVILINCPTEVYNHSEPDEYRLPVINDTIPYSWERRDR